MEMPKETFKKLIDEQFQGSYNKCGRILDLAPSTICRIANGTNKAGIKVITNVMKYCNEKDIDYQKYIFFN